MKIKTITTLAILPVLFTAPQILSLKSITSTGLTAASWITSAYAMDTLKKGVTAPNTLKHPAPQILKHFKLPTNCPDPAVVDIVIRPNGHNSNGTYNMHITPVIKNLGSVPYVSTLNQQNIIIKHGRRVLQAGKWYSRTAGINLAPGATTSPSVGYSTTTWNPNPGEFAEDITATISYDPDIRLDHNPKNDDCRSNNNTKAITVREINRRLHVPGY